MKLFLNCISCSNKISLAASALTRQQLSDITGVYFTVNCFRCQLSNQFHVHSVFAETTQGKTPYATGAGGGLIGVIAGPIGVVIGLLAGGVAGGITLIKDKEAVNRFNNSYI